MRYYTAGSGETEVDDRLIGFGFECQISCNE